MREVQPPDHSDSGSESLPDSEDVSDRQEGELDNVELPGLNPPPASDNSAPARENSWKQRFSPRNITGGAKKGADKNDLLASLDVEPPANELLEAKQESTLPSALPSAPTARAKSASRESARRTLTSGFVYDPHEADLAIGIRPLLNDKRFWRVARTLTTFVAMSISDKYSKDEALTTGEKARRRAHRVTRTLIELGPTFIKLGQFLSVRRDILSPEFADELTSLQDKVPPFASEEARAIIERDLGAPPETVFSRFSEETIASASIGQVHRAWLLDGKPVAVKIQRPDLGKKFLQDLGYMRAVIRLGMALRPSGEWDNWLKLSDEFGRTLFSELDYLQEGKNADRLRQILKGHDDIRIPRVFWKYTGRRVLTLEYIPGIKVNNIKALQDEGLNLVEIGNKLVSCYLDQVLLHGFFHADPHAGNMAIDEYGKVVLYDFGMIGEITQAQRDAITGCVGAVIKQDTDELVKHLKTLEIVKKDADGEPIRRALAPFIDYYEGKKITDLDFSHLETDIDQVASARALRMPPNLAYLLRAGSSIEGIARTLHPNFSFVEAAKPSLKRWITEQPEQAARVLKLMGADYGSIIKAAWMRLINAKSDDFQLTSKQEKSIEHKKLPVALDESKESRKDDPSSNQLMYLKNRVNDLEKQIEEANKNRVNLVLESLWLFSFAFLYLGTTLIPKLQPYATYFLIGNVVMVARIIRYLIRSAKVRSQSQNSIGNRRQRR